MTSRVFEQRRSLTPEEEDDGYEEEMVEVDMADIDFDVDLAEQVKSLQAAQRLEEQYQSVYENIAQMRKAIDEEDKKREQQLNQSNEEDYDSEELEIEEDNQIANADNVPIHERLMNFGSSLSLKLQLMQKAKEEKEREVKTPNITGYAKSIKRPGAIENRLIQSRDEQNARLEELRMERERRELKEVRGPQINKKSKDLKRDEPMYERFLSYKEQTMAKREMMKNQLEEKAKQELRTKPQINKKSQTLRRTLDTMIQWEKEKNMKTEQLRSEIKKQEEGQIQQPKINPISEKLATQMERGQDIGEYLIQSYVKKKMERELKLKQEKEKESQEARPQISVHSANLQRDGVVFDRLYEQTKKKDVSQAQIVNMTQPSIDPNTGQPLYQPIINTRSAMMVREEPVEEILLKKKEEAERKKQLLLEREKKELEAQGSKVGAYSQLLVELMERRTQSNTMERLTKQFKKPEVHNVSAGSFKPEINHNSILMDMQKNRGTPREDLLLQKGSEYERHKKEIERKIKEEEEAVSYSSPVVKKNKNIKTPSGSIVDRSIEWAKRKELKLNMEKKVLESKESEQCTFQPNVKRLDVSGIHPLESFIKPKDEENSYLLAMKNKSKENIPKPKVSATTPGKTKPTGYASKNVIAPEKPSILEKNQRMESKRVLIPTVQNPQVQKTEQKKTFYSQKIAPKETYEGGIIYDDIDPTEEFEQMKRMVQKDQGISVKTPKSNANNRRFDKSPSIQELLDSQSTLSELYKLSNDRQTVAEREERFDEVTRLTPEAYQLITDMIRNSRK